MPLLCVCDHMRAALSHVCASRAYLARQLHDPVRQSLLNGAEVVRKALLEKLGSDMTVETTHNPFYHTGNPVNPSRGSTRTHRERQLLLSTLGAI